MVYWQLPQIIKQKSYKSSQNKRSLLLLSLEIRYMQTAQYFNVVFLIKKHFYVNIY